MHAYQKQREFGWWRLLRATGTASLLGTWRYMHRTVRNGWLSKTVSTRAVSARAHSTHQRRSYSSLSHYDQPPRCVGERRARSESGRDLWKDISIRGGICSRSKKRTGLEALDGEGFDIHGEFKVAWRWREDVGSRTSPATRSASATRRVRST